MKNTLLTLLLLTGFAHTIVAQQYYYPPLAGNSWETVDPTAALGWCPQRMDSLRQFLEDKDSKAFVVLYRGRIALEYYFGTFTQDSLWYWASAGKSLAATMVGLAQEDGFLTLDERTSDYLGTGWTSCPPEKENLITIWNQISMTTGLNDALEDLGPNGATCIEPSCLQYLADAGTRWAYHNGPYHLVHDVVEAATGINFNTYTRNRLGNRIGMKGLWFNYIYYSKARDMARFGLFALSRGNWNGDQIMTDTAYFEDMTTSSQNLNRSYGYLWWLNGQPSGMVPGLQIVFPGSLIPEAPDDMYAALGKNDQKIYVVPSMDLVVVRQGNTAGGFSLASSSFDNQLWQRIMSLECTTPVKEPLAKLQFVCSPNPVSQQLRINAGGAMQLIELYDVMGNRVGEWHPENATNYEINTSHLPQGMYTVHILGEQSRGVGKIVCVKN